MVASSKEALMRPLVLFSPRTESQYTLDTEANEKQIRCVLLQEQEDSGNRPAGCWSRTLNDEEQKLATKNREWLAVIWTVMLLRLNVERSYLTIRADHKAL